MSYLDEGELRGMGFAALGLEVRISRRASIYGAGRIRIGSYTRIDDFCVISAGEGGVDIGSYVHIAPFCLITGSARVVLEDFSGLSSRVSIYSSSDDYSGEHMTNPAVPSKYTGVVSAEVRLGRHAIVGAGAVVLPGSVLGEGAAVGSLSLVNRNVEAFSIVSGVPARKIKDRSRGLLETERLLVADRGVPPSLG